jgi:hypothetical protein
LKFIKRRKNMITKIDFAVLNLERNLHYGFIDRYY